MPHDLWILAPSNEHLDELLDVFLHPNRFILFLDASGCQKDDGRKSSPTDEEIGEQALRDGAKKYFLKPNLDELFEYVTSILSQ